MNGNRWKAHDLSMCQSSNATSTKPPAGTRGWHSMTDISVETKTKKHSGFQWQWKIVLLCASRTSPQEIACLTKNTVTESNPLHRDLTIMYYNGLQPGIQFMKPRSDIHRCYFSPRCFAPLTDVVCFCWMRICSFLSPGVCNSIVYKNDNSSVSTWCPASICLL